MKTPVVMSWSGGKDSAVALHELRSGGDYDVVALLTTVSEEHRRISHHGVREELLDAQAAAIGLPIEKVYLPSGPAGGCSNEVYEAITAAAFRRFSERGVEVVAYGDLFLEDLRQWREASIARAGMRAVFPIWGRETRMLAREVIRDGYRAYISCVEGTLEQFVGRLYDEKFVAALPAGVDPCGENGEFHSFVFDGPPFARPVAVTVGETVIRDGRYYADLLPGVSAPVASIAREAIPPLR
ncbi:MAG: adenine nucleotide alpha hydrolase [Verrucomicrobiota bacterium]|nr:adenine nucleotide alpha hydrolase [Verrucomicrobiota bacterium]